MSRYTKGQKVYRYYTCEPGYIYGSGKVRELGEVLGEPVEYQGRLYVPVIWQYSGGHPDLAFQDTVTAVEENPA